MQNSFCLVHISVDPVSLQAKEVSALQCEKFEHSEIGMITGSEKTPGTDDE